jgi:predicted aspartyl protease
MKRYQLTVRHELLFTRAALKHQNRVRVVNLLIDSGSTYTILSWEVLLSLKLDPATSATRRSITTVNGLLVLPEVEVDEFSSLGQSVNHFPVLAHTIPLGSQVDGLLGMNFLRRFELTLNFKKAAIWS